MVDKKSIKKNRLLYCSNESCERVLVDENGLVEAVYYHEKTGDPYCEECNYWQEVSEEMV